MLYHSAKNWKTKEQFSSILTGFQDIFHKYIPDFKFILYDLSKYSDDEIKGTVIARVAMLLFKHIFSSNLPEKLEDIFMLFKDLSEQETGLQYIESLLKYVFDNTDDLSTERLKRIVDKTLSQEKGDIVMTLAEKLRQEGRREGRQEERKENLISFVHNSKKQGIPIETIAKIVELDKDLVQKILNNSDIEIPLHLLEPNE